MADLKTSVPIPDELPHIMSQSHPWLPAQRRAKTVWSAIKAAESICFSSTLSNLAGLADLENLAASPNEHGPPSESCSATESPGVFATEVTTSWSASMLLTKLTMMYSRSEPWRACTVPTKMDADIEPISRSRSNLQKNGVLECNWVAQRHSLLGLLAQSSNNL